MNDKNGLDRIRSQTLNSMARTEMLFKCLVAACGLAELIGLLALFWFTNWEDPTHWLIVVATLLVYCTLGLWVWALAVWNRVGDQRILRAIDVLAEPADDEKQQ